MTIPALLVGGLLVLLALATVVRVAWETRFARDHPLPFWGTLFTAVWAVVVFGIYEDGDRRSNLLLNLASEAGGVIVGGVIVAWVFESSQARTVAASRSAQLRPILIRANVETVGAVTTVIQQLVPVAKEWATKEAVVVPVLSEPTGSYKYSKAPAALSELREFLSSHQRAFITHPTIDTVLQEFAQIEITDFDSPLHLRGRTAVPLTTARTNLLHAERFARAGLVSDLEGCIAVFDKSLDTLRKAHAAGGGLEGFQRHVVLRAMDGVLAVTTRLVEELPDGLWRAVDELARRPDAPVLAE